MSQIWNFSSSLKDQVKLCISSARQDEHNKWLKMFGHFKYETKPVPNYTTETLINLCNSQENAEDNFRNDDEKALEKEEKEKNKLSEEFNAKNLDEIIEGLETDLECNFDVTVKECLANHTLLSLLAKRLSTPTIEKYCSLIYNNKEIDRTFLYKFFEVFLSNYVKREYNSSTLDILIRGSKVFPLEFRILLKQLIKDIKIPTIILQDYVLTLSERERSKFVIDLAEFDLSDEEFVLNLFSIYTAYKDCTKTDRTQNYVLSMLTQYSSICANDRNYGRLFLAYLQAQKCIKAPANYNKLEILLEPHRSPFKRPCLMIIKELASPNEKSASEDDSE